MCKPEIVLYPNKILKSKTKKVSDVTDSEVTDCISKLLSTMNEFDHCVGIAANQIGIDLQIFVADASKNKNCKQSHGLIVAVNPEITYKEGIENSREGCMSVPDLTGNVNRYQIIKFNALNENGDQFMMALDGFEARVIQHEIDHLNGKVFLDRVRSARDVFSRKKYS